MRDGEPSRTAAFVAGARGLGAFLPREARLAVDPFGFRFTGRVPHGALRLVGPVLGRAAPPFLVFMQVRTRVLDDAVRRFARGGGAQVVLLGAGYDCRALRLDPELGSRDRFFEVDHPATQRRKRELLRAAPARARLEFIPFHFERDPTSELPARLAEHGHDPTRRTLLIWEGVTPYLTEEAIDATLRAVRALACAGSELVLTYLERGSLGAFTGQRPTGDVSTRLWRAFTERWGEPYRFGWEAAELGPFMAARGFSVAWDRDAADLAKDLLPERYARRVLAVGRRIACVTCT